ncbi:L,D-transpeptidase [Komagataeibacter sp. FNDCF1]|uniref:L,D-transpeptidase family protein n=1 Tax=Komagataeibacter sp. FNDCF1 TaxID=2878681 RepID=UPI001E3801AB|nr:L,D-transpeptidase family protein [Komagataeibacter sp. FNDCF1]MCE2563984.1 L,D-transpeptidase family protein [Komagataeibacter sp. FNDCF1]
MGENMPAIIGAAGVKNHKIEGDHATPAGIMPLRRVFYRADRVASPVCHLPVEPLSPHDGWCDDPAHPDYNRHVILPHPARHERLWREDHVYDILVVLGYNDDPVHSGRGSAIFAHLPPAGGRPTEGCIALPEPVLRRLLAAGLAEIEVRPV